MNVRVRGVQVHGKAVPKAESGQRTAVNIAGVDVDQLERGMVIAEPKTLRPTQIIDVRIEVLPHASRGVKTRARVRLHIGASEVLGRIRVIEEAAEISQGNSGLAQLRLETPIVAVHGDRFILRSYSPAETIAGGIVLDVLANKHRGKAIETTRVRLQRLMSADRTDKVAALVESSGLQGARVDYLTAGTGWKRDVLYKAISEAESEKKIVEAGGVYLSPESFDRLTKSVVTELANHHKREPLARGILRETLREKVFAHSSLELFGGVLAKLESHKLIVSEKDVVRAANHRVGLSQEETKLKQAIEESFIVAGVEAPTIDEALTRAGVNALSKAHGRRVLQLLIDDKTLVKVHNELLMHKTVLEQLKAKVLKYGAEHEPERLIDVAAFKDLAGVSRKYAIPLLEYFDRERLTRRAGDKRLILK
jgi:selenocysteine-specific elongation factor